MRCLLIGAVQSSAVLLRAAIDAGADIVAVATLSPETGRRRHSDYADLAPVAATAGIPVRYIDNDDALGQVLTEFAPDILLVWGWSRLIPDNVLRQARLGGIGFHPAPLPHGRGRHPLIWTVLLDLPASAVCFFKLCAGADEGEILERRDFKVPPGVFAHELMDVVLREAVSAVPDLFAGLRLRGELSGSPQGEQLAPAWRKRSAADGKIDFRMSVAAIDRLVRALAKPYPGAEAEHAQLGHAKIWRVRGLPMRLEWRYAEPGRVLPHGIDSAAGPLVRCDDGAVCLLEHEFTQPIQVGSWFC